MSTQAEAAASPPLSLSMKNLIDWMRSAKRLDPQSCLPRPDLDRAVQLLGPRFANWHQAWQGLMMK